MARDDEDGRPVRLTTNVSTDAAQRLQSIAKAKKVKLSWLIALAVDEFLDRSGNDPPPQLPLRPGPPRSR